MSGRGGGLSPAGRPAAWLAVLAAELALLLAAPTLLAVAGALSPLAGGRRPVRVVLIAVTYAAHHVAACLACGALWLAGGLGRRPLTTAHYAVMRWFVAGVTRTMMREANVEVRLVDSDAAHATLTAGERPVVVLSRHAGEGDSLLVLHELLGHGRRPRIVMHHLLQADPLIAALGHRLPNRFVDPRGGGTERAIALMADGLGARDAVLIFPEGANTSVRHRARAVTRLLERGHLRWARLAEALTSVSAPRPGGAFAAIDAAPDAEVLVLAHAGFPEGLKDVWRRLPERQVVEVRLWVADPPPADRDARMDWLFRWWATVDAWVGERERARS
jgi:1-acyl-sn-glycerol-3-phosphate acyltransferase